MRLKTISTAVASSSRSWWPVFTIAILVGLLLFQQWRFTHPPAPAFLSVGEHLAPFSLSTLDGHPFTIDWASNSRPTVLYVFKRDCVWCSRNLEAARTLAQEVSSNGYRFVAVSVGAESIREYVVENRLSFPVYVSPSAKSLVKHLKNLITPETILVAPGGVVQGVWLGAYTDSKRHELEKVFNVRLPTVSN